jgi:DNA modification methylase
MSGATTLRMKSYIQPFERVLAMQELSALVGGSISPVAGTDNVWAAPATAAHAAKNKLAYWEAIGGTFTHQVRREATALVARNGMGLAEAPSLSRERVEQKIPRSRCLRYGPHGIHEYRGKFFPQLVKALMNVAGVHGGLVLDPMCGSGTTPVEAIFAGNRAIGLDMNPLSVFVSGVKCRALRLGSSEIVEGYASLHSSLCEQRDQFASPKRSAADESYLADWFSAGILDELDSILGSIGRIPNEAVSELFKVSLSNIIRRVSYQKEADLRVRREHKQVNATEVRTIFLEEALRSAKMVAADVAQSFPTEIGQADVLSGDARTFVSDGLVSENSTDVVITSPPYATALPYLDTDRLSLSYLGLLTRSEHRKRDVEMIGNREITDRLRREQWERYLEEGATLPRQVRALIDRIENENVSGTVGFRRRNLGALLATYFLDMRNVLVQIQRALKPGSQAFLVVGNNRTKTPAGEVEIETSELLLAIAASLGFGDCRRVAMEMLHSRDIFRENRTPSEHILSMRRQ